MKKILFIVFIFHSTVLFAQSKYYNNPVKIPMYLSGSFAELRSNHFHSGIDIKTQGVTGIPIFSVADGFISRISISPRGFGYALYIDHPNGTTSVYGHLNNFREDIEEFVKDKQYEKKSFRLDIKVQPDVFPVSKNELIAKSGNSGSSGGPHLHFEIRNSYTEEPLNPLKYGFSVTDKTPPKIFSLLIIPLSDSSHVNYGITQKSYPVLLFNGKYQIKNNLVIPVINEIGFAVQTNDYFDGSGNKCGIYSLELLIDSELYFSYIFDKFSFENSRYINSHIVYDEYISSKRRYQKTWIEPGNQLNIYNYIKNHGFFKVTEDQVHQVELIIKDTYGNSSILEFNIEGKFKQIKPTYQKFANSFEYEKLNYFNNNDIQLKLPKGALYSNINFQYKKTNSHDGYFSDLHSIHKNSIPLHKNIEIRLKTKNLKKSLHSKALLVNVDTLTNRFYASGGNFKNGWVESSVRYFGTYAVAVDTVPPKIIPLSIKNRNKVTESTQIRFKISDDLAGIEKIEGYLDGKWALFEYDAKRKLITHYFDSTRFEFNKQHQFQLKISDYRGNTTNYEASFWK